MYCTSKICMLIVCVCWSCSKNRVIVLAPYAGKTFRGPINEPTKSDLQHIVSVGCLSRKLLETCIQELFQAHEKNNPVLSGAGMATTSA